MVGFVWSGKGSQWGVDVTALPMRFQILTKLKGFFRTLEAATCLGVILTLLGVDVWIFLDVLKLEHIQLSIFLPERWMLLVHSWEISTRSTHSMERCGDVFSFSLVWYNGVGVLLCTTQVTYYLTKCCKNVGGSSFRLCESEAWFLGICVVEHCKLSAAACCCAVRRYFPNTCQFPLMKVKTKPPSHFS